MIREVKSDDFEQVLELVRKTVKLRQVGFKWKEEDAKTTIEFYMKAAYMLVEEQQGLLTGYIIGHIVREPFDYSRKVFTEVGWYSKKNGFKLFSRLIRELKAKGVNRVLFPAPNKRTAQFYNRKGFKILETQWSKEL